MWRLAVATLRYRRSGLVATFITMSLGTAIVLACRGLMETGIRGAVPPQGLAAAAVVVAGNQVYELPRATPADNEEDPDAATLVERVRVDAGLVRTIEAMPDVAKAIGEVSFPATVLAAGRPAAGGAEAQGHSWAAAALAPYSLRAGAAPARPGEVVVDTFLARRLSVGVGDRIRIAAHGVSGTYEVSGVATPVGDPESTQPALFFSAADAGRLAGHPGVVDAIGSLPPQGLTSTSCAGGSRRRWLASERSRWSATTVDWPNFRRRSPPATP